ncbi:DNA replication factor C [Spraguea lophii 42_110]|uniref:DNA replication factor C n=1 Tax=Spraguea lophii (strain 42_110) TaxID=1358809 RepID=S7XR96_SPRLO|nr:DNA replication factor C [Spraguea lophii 42_110]
MIFIEKYRPRTFDSLKYRENIKNILKSYTVESIPHLIIYGGKGYGKKTIVNSLIHHLYNTEGDVQMVKKEIKTSSGKTLAIKFLESAETIELTPSEYNTQDKTVIQTIIKDIAQTKSILGLLTSTKKKIKLIILNEAEKLSKEAQAALRRTVEVYSPNFRIVLICNDLSGIIEPLKSRSLLVRVDAIENNNIFKHVKDIIKREKIDIDDKSLQKLIESSEGNIRRILCFLELRKINEEKKQNFYLDWEHKALDVVHLVKTQHDSSTVLEIRQLLYDILVQTISADNILDFLLKNIIKNISFIQRLEIIEAASKYSERIKLGTKPIFHLEAFIVTVMCILAEK